MITQMTSGRFVITNAHLKNYNLFVLGFILQAVVISWWNDLERYTFIKPSEAVKVYSVQDSPVKSAEWSCEEDETCIRISEVIYFESRSESTQGQIAVGWVVMNRLNSKYFPDDVNEIVESGCAFEYWCKGHYLKGINDPVAWEKALKIASLVYGGEVNDPTNGASHFVNKNKLTRWPKWLKMYRQTVVIGQHSFYKM